jgi:hypothetical protein
MKKIIITLMLFTITVKAQVVNYNQHYDDITNPERGYYYHSTSWSTEPGVTFNYQTIEPYEVGDCNTGNMSLIQRIIRLDSYKFTATIPQGFLDKITADFGILRAAGLKCILRFSYSNYYPLTSSQVYEPSLNVLLGHINQLKTITMANEDVFSSMEAGFIGNYGEWYNSKTTTPNLSDFGLGDPSIIDANPTYKANRTQVANAIMTLTPNRKVAFRTPYFQQLLAPTLKPLKLYPKFNNSIFGRTAAHNDAFMHNLLDQGTYRNISGDNGAADRSYLESKSRNTFTGGESNELNFDFATCLNNYNLAVNTIQKNAIQQMEAYHYNYLNYSYVEEIMSTDTDDSPVTGLWFSTTYNINGNCLNEVKRRLGYRFVMNSTNLTTNNGQMTLVVNMSNVGFGNVFNPRKTYLVLDNGTLKYKVAINGPVDSDNIPAPSASTNVCAWYAGTTFNLSRKLNLIRTIAATPGVLDDSPVPTGTYSAYLEFPDDVSTLAKNSIRIASKTAIGAQDVWNNAGYNDLFRTVSVTNIVTKSDVDGIAAFDVISSPNPFNQTFKLNISTSSEESVTIKVYDMIGKLIEDKTVEASQLENLEIGSKLSTGVYNVIVKQGTNEKTVRVIKN